MSAEQDRIISDRVIVELTREKYSAEYKVELYEEFIGILGNILDKSESFTRDGLTQQIESEVGKLVTMLEERTL